MNMENLDIKDIVCFGFSVPKNECWFQVLHTVNSSGWKSIDMKKFEKNLNDNIIASYNSLVGIRFIDLDTDTEYFCEFNNQKKAWTLQIPGSPDDAVDPEDKKEYFKSEAFKRTTKRAHEILSQSIKSYEVNIKPKLEAGDFINIDETKAEAVEYFINDPQLLKNLKNGKFEK